MRSFAWAALIVAGACTGTSPGDGPVARSLAAAADDAGVPRELLAAIAIEEGGVHLPALRFLRSDDQVPVAGALELRHGRLDTLALGARLAGTTEAHLRVDTELATRAGALVVAQLGAQTGAGDSLASWHRALELLSGMDDANAVAYADRVLAILRTGGTFRARAGEALAVARHPELAAATSALAPSTTPDFPGAIWFQTSCTGKCDVGRPLGHASVDKIVIHDTEGGWDGSVATLQNDAGKSVHYIVDADGSRVGQFRPETDTTWHAGNYTYNETSIGIEHVGVADDPAGYASGLYATSRALVASIRSRWTIPLDRAHIIGHYQVPDGTNISASSAPCSATLETCEDSADYGGANNHRDPGFNWQWCQYMEKLGGTCACADAWPMWNCTTDGTEAVRCHDGVVEIDHCTGGCDVMPIGTEDVCHVHTDAPGSGPAPGAGASPDAPPDPSAGCSTGANGGSAGVLLALVALSRRRRPTLAAR